MKTAILILGTLITLLLNQIWAQESRNFQMPMIGSEAPSFQAKSTNGDIDFPKDFAGKWKILFSHPKDFTPVCSSEILELAYQQELYEKLGTKLIVLSTDLLDSHLSWKAALEEISFEDRPPVKIHFPLVEDHLFKISDKYGMIHSSVSKSENIRGVFIIDPENKVRAISFYPIEVGRNMEEIHRTLIALQTNYNNPRVALPANWQPGNDVMLPYPRESDKAEMGRPNSNIYQKAWFMTYMRLE